MRISGPHAPGSFAHLSTSKRALAIAALVLAWSTLAFTLGAATQATGFWGHFVRPALEAGARLPGRWLGAWLSEPERMEIDIKFQDWQKLFFQRDKAVREQAIFASEGDYVPAVIRIGDLDTKVDIRLKGDSAAHLQGEKWSFRVDLKGENTLHGMRRFSLQDPGTRNFIGEWVYHRALLREDILALRYDFVDVTVNGKHLGIYSLEEHFDKPLIEQNRRRYGPILRFDEELLWREAHHQLRPFGYEGSSGYGAYEASAIDGFRTNQALAEPGPRALYLKAAHQLEGFRRGELAAAEVFDTHRLATYLALTDLLGAEHGARWHNIRFYFNPITSRLEPIGFDAECKETRFLQGAEARGLGADGLWQVLHRPFYERLFADRGFQAQYLAELERVSQPVYLDALFADLAPAMGEALAILHRDFPQIDSPEPLFRHNQEYIRSMLNPFAAMRAALVKQDDSTLRLDVGNLQVLPIEVIAIEHAAGSGNAAARIDLAAPLYLPPRVLGALPRFEPLTAPLPDGGAVDSASLRVVWRIPGTKATHTEAVTPYSASDDPGMGADPTRQSPNLERYPFITIDKAARTATIAPGRWTITETLVVPPGLTLVAGPGAELDLVQKAMIFSYSPLQWQGTKEAPVVLRSSDGTGQGLVVMQARDPSTIRHVVFADLAAPATEGYSLTGSITFFESPVTIESSEFAHNDSEDALNVVRGSVHVEKTLFRDTRSDAFDCDFCTGEFIDTHFLRLGNDGIDVSGAKLRVEHMRVDGARDKGISVGENSSLEAVDIEVNDANVGLASKDKSVLRARDVRLRGCRYGLTALIKKAEFGASELYVEGLSTQEMEGRNLIDGSATVIVDGVRLAQTGEQHEIWEMLYGDDAPGRSIR